MKDSYRKISVIIVILVCSIYFSFPFTVIGEEPINKEETKTEIMNQASQQTSNITVDTSSTQTKTEIVNSGDNVQSDTSAQSDNQTQVSNNNEATVNQDVNATANTGNNEASRNISIGGNAGVITTGNASVNVSSEANVNNNGTAVGSGEGTVNTSGLVNSGNGVTSTSSSSSQQSTYVTNTNAAYINQTANANANTGNNKADRNISIGGNAGVITTGNASTNLDFMVTANGSVVLVGGKSDGNGPGSGASIHLINTGDNSRFSNLASYYTSKTVTNRNNAYITQSCGNQIPGTLVYEMSGCYANTGYNTANRNIGFGGDAGVINTGDATVDVNLYANANTNDNSIDSGNATNNSNTQAVNTGDNVDVNSQNNTSTSTQVNNSNKAHVNQKVNAYANTGYNTANRNISFGGNAGIINTGNATVNVKLKADVNSNNTGINNSDNLQCEPNYADTAIVHNGNNATFSSNSNSNSSAIVQNSNDVNADQILFGKVDTGNNYSSRNVGSAVGIINTGNSLLSANAVITGNSNTTKVTCSTCIDAVTPGPTGTAQNTSTTHLNVTPTSTQRITQLASNNSNPTTTATPTPTNAVSSSSGSSSSSNSSDSGEVNSYSDHGQVLGAFASRLPTTGTVEIIPYLLMIICIYAIGSSLKKFRLGSRYYTLSYQKGGETK